VRDIAEILEILLEDEIQRRSNKRLATRIIRAHFDEEKNLEGFDFTFNPKLPAQYIRELATCQFIERKESVILCGPVGVGKTHLAQALGHQACRGRLQCPVYEDQPSLIRFGRWTS